MLRCPTEFMGSALTCNPCSAGDATAVLRQSCIRMEIAYAEIAAIGVVLANSEQGKKTCA
jgi:hypothetical protein